MHHDRETGHFTVSADIHVSICGCNLLLTINVKKIRNSFFGYVQEVFVSLFLCLFIPDTCALSAKHPSLAHKIQYQRGIYFKESPVLEGLIMYLDALL